MNKYDRLLICECRHMKEEHKPECKAWHFTEDGSDGSCNCKKFKQRFVEGKPQYDEYILNHLLEEEDDRDVN